MDPTANGNISNKIVPSKSMNTAGNASKNQAKNVTANATKNANEEKRKKHQEWMRFRKLYSFFLLLVILYLKRPGRRDEEASAALQILQITFTEENYMSKLDEAMKILFPKIVEGTEAAQIRGNKDAHFQTRILEAMKAMYNVTGFMDMYQKMCEAESQIKDNKEFFMTFHSFANFGQAPDKYDSNAGQSVLFLIGPNASTSSLVPQNNSLLSTFASTVTKVANKVSSSIQSTLSSEREEELKPIQEILNKVATAFSQKSIYKQSAALTPTNATPAPVPSNATPAPVPSNATPAPVPTNATQAPAPTNATQAPAPTNATQAPAPINAASTLPAPTSGNATSPATNATPTVPAIPPPQSSTPSQQVGGKKKNHHTQYKKSQSQSQSKSPRISLRKLWELS